MMSSIMMTIQAAARSDPARSAAPPAIERIEVEQRPGRQARPFRPARRPRSSDAGQCQQRLSDQILRCEPQLEPLPAPCRRTSPSGRADSARPTPGAASTGCGDVEQRQRRITQLAPPMISAAQVSQISLSPATARRAQADERRARAPFAGRAPAQPSARRRTGPPRRCRSCAAAPSSSRPPSR